MEQKCKAVVSYQHLEDVLQKDANVVFTAPCTVPEGQCPLEQIDTKISGPATIKNFVDSTVCVKHPELKKGMQVVFER